MIADAHTLWVTFVCGGFLVDSGPVSPYSGWLIFWYPFTGDTKFDASQYAFFGNNAVEEVELGGLDDDDGDTAFVEHGDEEYPLYGRDNILEVAYMVDLFYASQMPCNFWVLIN